MAIYNYVAKNSTGQNVSGVLEADSEETVTKLLSEKGLIIISVTKSAGEEKRKIKEGGKKVKLESIVVMSRQLATMVNAGLPLFQALDILSDQMEDKNLQVILSEIKNEIEKGSSFSEALAKYPKTFSNLYINMIKAGEVSGMLDDILDRLASYLEKTAKLQRKVKSAMVYPASVTTIAIAITILLLVKVVPTFRNIFDGFGAELPMPTKVLLFLSDTIRENLFYGIAVLGALAFALKKYIATEKGRYKFDLLILNVPIFGILLRKVAVAKFARTFSTLIKSGVPILQSLDIVGKTAGNVAVEKAVSRTKSSIQEGASMAVPLAESGIFPPMVIKMIAVGEKTGALEAMLGKVADFYDDQVDAAVTGLTSLIEPLLISFLGIVIGGIVIAMFMPMFQMVNIVQ